MVCVCYTYCCWHGTNTDIPLLPSLPPFLHLRYIDPVTVDLAFAQVFPDGGGWVEFEGFIELNRILRKDMDFHSSSPEASETSPSPTSAAAGTTFMDVGVGDAIDGIDGAATGHDGGNDGNGGNGGNGAGDGAGGDGGDGWRYTGGGGGAGDARDSSIQWQVLEATETAKDTMWQQMTDPETGTVYFYSGTRGLLGGESSWAIPFQVHGLYHIL